jgi:uncharacterized protein YjcR
MIPVPNH